MNILITSRTKWSETPRIRHQLTLLLKDAGHNVTFVEKCNRFGSKLNVRIVDGVSIVAHSELCHHQLKPFGWIQKIYNVYAIRQLKKSLGRKQYDVVCNFNYDYSFLNNIFPNAKVITLINDDFEAQAKFWMRRSIRLQLAVTCEKSYATLAVSYPLLNKIKPLSKRAFLFLPWCEEHYIKPNVDNVRNIVLYFGFINSRIDWVIVEELLNEGVKLRFVGPINEIDAQKKITQFSKCKNFEYLMARDFNELFLDDVSCSIAPYDMRIESIKACTVSNRAFRLLSRGIPVIYPPLPYILEAPKQVISTAKDLNEYMDLIKMYEKQFDSCQYLIEKFLPQHSANTRYDQLSVLLF